MSRKISIVAGIGFGDEGKGLVTSALCFKGERTLVVRYGGGHQCGHTVVTRTIDNFEGEVRHVFSNFGSGTLHGADSYFSKYTVIDPVGIMNEYKVLREKYNGDIRLYIDDEAMVVTPWDKHSNRYLEGMVKHGSCGVGFGTTINRNEKNYRLFARDILFTDILEEKVRKIKEYYGATMYEDDKTNPSHVGVDEFKEALLWLVQCNEIKIHAPSFTDYDHVVFEGHQGTMLDQKYGIFPHVTRSDTTVKNAISILKDSGHSIGYNAVDNDFTNPNIYYVTRVYQTRHGNGPMSSEKYSIELQNNEQETNVSHEWQGEFRTGIVDMNLLRYAIRCNRYHINMSVTENLVVTCCDQLKNNFKYMSEGKVKTGGSIYDVFVHEQRIPKLKLSTTPYTEYLFLKEN